MDEILKKPLSAARETDSRADRYFFKCKNLSRYPIIHGSKRTLLYPGAFRLYVHPKAILTFRLGRNTAY